MSLLLNIFQPFMSSVLLAGAGGVELEPAELQKKLEESYLNTREKVGQYRLDSKYFDDACFAVSVWADEKILLSDQKIQLDWLPLQVRFYHTNCGGEEFFDRLDTLLLRWEKEKNKNLDQGSLSDVIMVYTACLATGFKGRYYGLEDKKLKAYLKQVHKKFNFTEYKSFQPTLYSRGRTAGRKGWFNYKVIVAMIVMLTVVIGTKIGCEYLLQSQVNQSLQYLTITDKYS